MVNPVVNQTNIIAPRVPIIDERTGLISREWYRFFLNLFVLTGSGQNDTSLLDLQVGPPVQPLIDVGALNPEPNGFAAYAALSTLESQVAELQKQVQDLSNLPVDLSEVWKQLQALALMPATQEAALTIGEAILYGNGSGGFSNVAIGTGVSFTSGTLSATGTGGTVTSVAALTLGTTGTDLSSTVANGTTTPVITLQVPTASATNRGALSSADWSTFNNKQPAGSYVPYTGANADLNMGAYSISAVNLTASGITTLSAGTAAAPALTTAGDTNTGIFFPAADTIAFSEGGVESMRIDSAGNLGLGVMPSAVSANWNAIQISSTGATIRAPISGTNLQLGQNFTGVGAYAVSSVPSGLYSITQGTHSWYTAPSGTAGNPITFTQAMTLNASGNLGIGTSSPSASAILDAQSTTKGVRMPNMTTIQKNAISSPAAGLMVFDTTLAKLCVYTGAVWETVTSI